MTVHERDSFFSAGAFVSSAVWRNRISHGHLPITFVDVGGFQERCLRWKRHYGSVILLLTTMLWLSLTVWLSFATCHSDSSISLPPQITVLLLSFLSGGSMFLLGELAVRTFEILRWTLA